MPARDLRRKPYYLTSKGVSTGIKIDKVAGSRGCPFNCKFCSFAINPWGVKRCWTPRSPASIVREIEQIDADLVLFVDDVFTHQPDRVAEICDLLIAKKIRKHYIVNARLGDRQPPRRPPQDGAGRVHRPADRRRVDAGRDAQVDGQGVHHRTDPRAVRGAPQVEDGHQRVFHRGQHRRNRGADALHRVVRPVDRRRPDPRLPLAQRAATRAWTNWSSRRPATTSTTRASSTATPTRPSTSPNLRKRIDRQFHSSAARGGRGDQAGAESWTGA